MSQDGDRTSLGSNLTSRTRRISVGSSFIASTILNPSRWTSRNTLHSSTLDLVHQQIEAFAPQAVAVNTFERELVDEPDKGYAWVVLACCTILQLVPFLPIASAGLFYVEFVESFDQSPITISWMCSIQSSISLVFGPVAALLMDRTSARTCALVGCIGTSLFLAVSSIITSYEALFITYGILSGAFMSFTYIPSVVYAAKFFNKYRVLALSTTVCCVPLVFLIIPPSVTKLLEIFNWRETNMVLAVVSLQSSVLAMLLRPIRNSEATVLISGRVTRNLVKGSTSRLSQYKTSQYSLFSEDPEMRIVVSNDIIDFPEVTRGGHLSMGHHGSQMLQRPEFALETIEESKPLEIKPHYEKIEDDIPKPEAFSDMSPSKVESNRDLYSVYSVRDIDKKDIDEAEHNSGCSDCLRSMCSWRIAILLLSCFIWGWAGTLFYILLPDYAKLKGLSAEDTSMLFMVSGTLGVVCRVAIVVTGHFFQYKRTYGLTTAFLLMALSFLGFVYSSTLAHFIMNVVTFSIGFAVLACSGGPVILEIHGEQDLEWIYGLEMLSYGVGSTLSTPFTTFLLATYGSYSMGYVITAAIALSGALIFLPHIIPLVIGSCREAENKTNANDSDDLDE